MTPQAMWNRSKGFNCMVHCTNDAPTGADDVELDREKNVDTADPQGTSNPPISANTCK